MTLAANQPNDALPDEATIVRRLQEREEGRYLARAAVARRAAVGMAVVAAAICAVVAVTTGDVAMVVLLATIGVLSIAALLIATQPSLFHYAGHSHGDESHPMRHHPAYGNPNRSPDHGHHHGPGGHHQH